MISTRNKSSMTDTANALYHPRGCTTICQSDTPCLCIRAFRISQRVGFDNNHLLLRYHEAPAADTSIASGSMGIERRGRPSFLTHPERLARPQLVSLSCREFFSYLTQHSSLESKTAFSYFCVLILSRAEQFWSIFD